MSDSAVLDYSILFFPAACNWTRSGFKRETRDRRLLQDECDLLAIITVFARQKESLCPTSFFLAIMRLFATGWHCKCNPTSIHDCAVLANFLLNPFFKLFWKRNTNQGCNYRSFSFSSIFLILLCCYLVYKMAENDITDQCFPKPRMTISNVLCLPQSTNNLFIVWQESINQKISTFQ